MLARKSKPSSRKACHRPNPDHTTTDRHGDGASSAASAITAALPLTFFAARWRKGDAGMADPARLCTRTAALDAGAP